FLKQIELVALGGRRQITVFHITDDGARINRAIVDVRALVYAGQEAVAPQLRTNHGPPRTKNDEPGKVLVLRSQSIAQPRTQAGPDRRHVAGVHHQQARLMVGIVGVHTANNADVVDALGDFWEEVADVDAALAVTLEDEWRGHARPVRLVATLRPKGFR